MKIKSVSKKLIDVFLDPEKHHKTGYDESLWLRLQQRGSVWTQIAGIKLPSWRYKQLIENIPK